MVASLLPFGLAASGLLNVHDVLRYVPEHVVQSSRSAAAAPSSDSQRRAAGDLFSPAIDTFIRTTIDQWELHGLSIAIVRRRDDGGFDVSTRGYGVAGLDGRPVTADTLLPIGSNSKAFTVAALGHLVANASVGIDWSSRVHQLLPEFKLQDAVATKQAKLVDLFSHRTGLPRHDFCFHDDGKPLEDYSLRMVKHLSPSAEFREATQYNNHMFNIGASLVAKTSGVPFEDFVQKHIFDAAGMSSSTYRLVDAAAQGKLAEGFVRLRENTTYSGDIHATIPHKIEEKIVMGAGAIASTANDIAKWLQVLLNGGASPQTGKQVVPAAVLQKMQSGITVYSPPAAPELGPSVYGMALASSSYQGHQYVEHGGSLMGYLSQINRFPNDGLGIAILTNEYPRGQFVMEIIKWRIAEEILGLPLRVDWNARYQFAYRAVLQFDEEAAKARLPRSPSAPLPSAPIAALAGTYRNPAYGTLNTTVLKTDKYTLRASATGSLFLKHVDLGHYAGNVFNATVAIHMPALDTPSGETEDHLVGVLGEFGFDTRGRVLGFGLSAEGALWGAGNGLPVPSGKTARERAEIWFDRA
ncbi:beta-lactamase/transpeptidase-like protein [Auricularia subglabra TFB-10046 SS5]|nr:beta-lactamase/transpeptidase-like protein [Auricularia subglabra TFB-10046 SS5]